MNDLNESARKDVDIIIRNCEGLTVVDESSFVDAGNWITKIVQTRKQIGEFFDGPISDAHGLHKKLLGQKNTFDDPLSSEENRLRGERKRYIKFKEEKREEERKRIAHELGTNLKHLEYQYAEQMSAEEKFSHKMQEEEYHEAALREHDGKWPVQKIWFGVVDDITVLLQAVIDGSASPACVTVDYKYLKKLANQFQGSIDIPGVKWDYEVRDRVIY